MASIIIEPNPKGRFSNNDPATNDSWQNHVKHTVDLEFHEDKLEPIAIIGLSVKFS
jgi:hypothetical protein